MSSAQTSFGSRIDNAKKIWVHTTTFPEFNPPTEQSVIVFGQFLTDLEKHNTDTAGKIQEHSNATHIRQKSFKTGKDSLTKMSIQILAAIRSQFGKNSRQATDVKIIVARITGSKVKKMVKEPDPGAQQSAATETRSISHRETGFGNLLKTFGDIVATVKNYGEEYTPGNPSLTIKSLESRLVELSAINRDVTATYSALQQNRFERIALYKKLADTIQRIKNAVVSQYRAGSVEHVLIKGIKV